MRCQPGALVILLAIAACASPPPSPSAVLPSTSEPPVLDCGSVADDACRSVADAAQLMTGTAPLTVTALPLPTDGGLPMDERYVVTLEGGDEDGDADPQLVEVVRFVDSDNWSVRRLDRMPAD
jgi:hypothetical protein